MHRFFCNPQNISPTQIQILDKREIHHIKDVLRLKNNDQVVVLNGQGAEFTCQINQIERNHVKLNIVKKRFLKKEKLGPRITIACALPKKSKIDSIVEKLTEIGVDRIILLKTERTEMTLKDPSKKVERLRKTAESALKQSGNVYLPEIEFMNFKELLRLKIESEFDLAIIPNLEAGARSLKGAIGKNTIKNILIAIGPEGDFSKEEINLARKSGFVSVNLGNTVLRVETAAIVTAGFLKLYLSKD